MATRKPKELDPDWIYDLRVDVGKLILYANLAWGEGAMLKVPGRDVPDVVAQGATVVPAKDAASR